MARWVVAPDGGRRAGRVDRLAAALLQLLVPAHPRRQRRPDLRHRVPGVAVEDDCGRPERGGESSRQLADERTNRLAHLGVVAHEPVATAFDADELRSGDAASRLGSEPIGREGGVVSGVDDERRNGQLFEGEPVRGEVRSSKRSGHPRGPLPATTGGTPWTSRSTTSGRCSPGRSSRAIGPPSPRWPGSCGPGGGSAAWCRRPSSGSKTRLR